MNDQQIHAAIRARLDELAPALAEHQQLTEALGRVRQTLGLSEPSSSHPALLPDPAPLGYKADGTPRRRRAPADPDYARKGWQTRRASITL